MKSLWHKHGSRIAYRNRIHSLREVAYSLEPSDNVREYTVFEFADWVNIIPVTPEGQFVMIRQFRHGIDEDTLEIPGGLIDAHETDPLEAAVREMREETGYTSTDVIHIGTVHPNPAIQNNLCHSYLARDVKLAGAQDLDTTESIQVELMDRDKVFEALRSGGITHALVLAAFAYLMLFEQKESLVKP